MNFMALVAAIATFGSAVAVFAFLYPRLVTLGERYQNYFEANTEKTFTEMFIFIDPTKLYLFNLLVLAASFVIGWFLFGNWLPALILSVCLGSSPKFIYNYLKKKRQQTLLKDLPDALLSIAGMMAAGTNLSLAMETMVAETDGPIGQEFGLFLQEVRVGVSYEQALDNLYLRNPVVEIQLVVSAMKISREIGGSLADILRRLSETLRKKMEMEGKIRALTAQGKMQGVVMALLPFVIAYALFHIEEEAMSKLWIHPIGWGVCGFAVIMVSLGYYFIRKIVNIDV